MNDGKAGVLHSGYQYSSLSYPAAQTHESRSSIYYQVQFNIKKAVLRTPGTSRMEDKTQKGKA